MNSIQPREAGPSGPIPSSSTTTGSTKAATSPPGSNRSCFVQRSERASDRCANLSVGQGPRSGRSARAAVSVEADEAVERQRAGAEGHKAKSHRRPVEVEVRPAVRIDELDHRSHGEKAERRVTCEQANDEKDRQNDLGRARERCDQLGVWERSLLAKEVKPILVGEERFRSEGEGEPAVPAREAGGEEWARERQAQHKQSERWRREGEERAGEARERGEKRRPGGRGGSGAHAGSPDAMDEIAPASTRPTRWAPKSSGSAKAAAASAKVAPPLRRAARA